jgi:predicted CxxxxCH...CXXCH cytochrome family protein
MLGDDSTYGAEVKGHNLATGSYTDADLNVTNPAANKACNACHDVAIAHLNNADDTSYTGNRLLTTINTVATASTVTGSCNACHATAAGTPATSQVSTHGNVNTSFTALSTHDGNAEQFGYRCEACHEVHGMVNGAGYVNIYMIKPAVGVGASFTTTPGGAGTTTATIRFVRVSGTDSYDDGLTTTDNVCVACHANAGRPGGGTAMTNNGGNHAANNDYTANEQGRSCIGCHSHNYDANVATADGFMPLQCNGCHTYPGLSGTAPANQHQLSAVHDEHVGRPSTLGTISNKGFSCSVCHYGSQHNNAGITTGLNWASVTAAHIQVRFDPSWNPATTTANDGGATDSTDYVGTTCNNLYCHGATLGAGGTATSPVWSGTLAGCTYCHLDTTALNSRSHGPHLTTTTGAGAVCADCHTGYDLSAAGNHMNGSVTFVAAVTYDGNAADRLPTTGLGSCGTNRCHNNGQNSAPILAYTWGTAINATNSCTECHQVATNLLVTNSHGAHLTTTTGVGVQCFECHGTGAATAATHANGTVNFNVSGGAVTFTYGVAADAVVALNGGTFGSCGTNRCHNNGQSAPTVSTYTWGTAINGTGSCNDCHNATTGTLVTNSHGPHLTTTTGAGVQCFECHGTGAATAATHANGTVNFNVSGGAVTFTYGVAADAVVALNGGTFGSCGTNRCHNNGQSAPTVSTYTWGTAINGTGSCNDCHNATTGTLATNSHGPHLTTTTGAGAQCADCHGASPATAATHGDGTVNFNVGGGAVTFTYGVAADRVVALTGGTFGTCGTNRCHNNGQSAPPIAGYTWGTAINGTNSCTECHNATTGTLVTLRHADHLAMPTYVCSDCHDAAAATVNTHADGTVNLKAGLTYSGAPGTLTVAAANTFGSCSTGSCHNGTASPTGNVVWNSTASNCDQCHLVTTAATEDNWNGQNKVMSAVVSTEWTGVGHGRGGIALACTACHSIAVAHDTTTNLTGATSNPYRLSAAFTCSNATAACHTAGKSGPVTGVDISTIKDHDKANMSNGKRTWPWTPQCANCHDPHGDAANIAMIGNELYDSAALNLLGAPGGGINAENVTLVFTNATVGQDASGASYANSGVPYSSICQECHTAAGTGMLSYLDNTNTSAGSHPSATGGNPGDCSNCHKHAEGFNPSGCVSCHDGSVALAPNVIDGTLPSNPALSYNWFGTDGAKQDGGHGDPQGRDGGPAPECGDCHDILIPAGTHGDGIRQSVFNNATRNANTAHLKAEYFVRSSPPSVPVGAGTWSTQVYFDNYCAEKCHPGKSVPAMRHEIDTLVTDTNHWSIELGTHLTLSDGDALGANYPIDADLNTAANAADVDYVPCVGCHDPHGTTVVEPSKTSNRMVRDAWIATPTLCNACHL